MLMKVGEFGRREVVVASAHELVTEVARRMRAHHVGSVVVVEHALGARIPVGVVTDRDIVVGLVALDPARIERAVVSELLVGKVVTAREDEDLDDAISRMRSHGVRRLPIVTESGTLVGIVSAWLGCTASCYRASCCTTSTSCGPSVSATRPTASRRAAGCSTPTPVCRA